MNGIEQIEGKSLILSDNKVGKTKLGRKIKKKKIQKESDKKVGECVRTE